MKQLTPFSRYLFTHVVIISNSGNASFTFLTVNATACNHFIHTTELLKFKEIKVCPAGILSIEMLLSTLPEAEALVDSGALGEVEGQAVADGDGPPQVESRHGDVDELPAAHGHRSVRPQDEPEGVPRHGIVNGFSPVLREKSRYFTSASMRRA